MRSTVSAEADKRAVVFTREWGKVTVIVPGAKKIKARHSAAGEPVTESDFMVYANAPGAPAKVTGTRILDHFAPLRCDWRRFCMAQYCAEVTDAMTLFHAESVQKYDLLARTWKLLENAAHPWRIYMAFTLRLLRLSGYSFTEYIKAGHSFVSDGERGVIRQMATLPGEEVDTQISISRDEEKDIARYIDAYLNLYIPRPLGTRKFWQQLT